jgi:hypothetical protein
MTWLTQHLPKTFEQGGKHDLRLPRIAGTEAGGRVAGGGASVRRGNGAATALGCLDLAKLQLLQEHMEEDDDD